MGLDQGSFGLKFEFGVDLSSGVFNNNSMLLHTFKWVVGLIGLIGTAWIDE